MMSLVTLFSFITCVIRTSALGPNSDRRMGSRRSPFNRPMTIRADRTLKKYLQQSEH